MPFQRSTITSEDVPMPKTKRPGAASAMAATLMAMRPGPRVKAGTMATPRRACGAQAQGLADAERHDVTEDREGRARDVEARDARPQGGPAVARRTGELVGPAPVGEPHVHARHERALVALVGVALGAGIRRRHLG